MIPLHLTLSGFLSYREPVEVDFTSFSLACISGQNGAGKSSLLDAVTWALFGQARKRDESVINAQSQAAEVALIFAYEGAIYRVQRTLPRGKTSLLEFQISQNGKLLPGSDSTEPGVKRYSPWKPLTERSLRETEARIRDTLSLDYETFVNASFFIQGKADQFTQQRPGDRKRILSSILGLDVWEDYRQRASERRRGVEAEIIALDATLAEINNELSEEAARKEKLAQFEREMKALAEARQAQERSLENVRKLAALLAERKKQVDESQRRLESDRKMYDEWLQLLEARKAEREGFVEKLAHAEKIEAAYADWKQAQISLGEWEETAAKFREHQGRRQEQLGVVNEEKARLTQELQTLLEQKRQAGLGAAEVARQTDQLTQAQGDLEQLEAEWAHKAELEEKLQGARQRQADARAENPRLKTEMEELKERIDQLTAAEGADCPLCGQPLLQADRERLIAELAEQGLLMGNRFRANKAYLDQANETVIFLEKEIAALNGVQKKINVQHQSVAALSTSLELLNRRLADWHKEGEPRLLEVQQDLENETYAQEARHSLAEIDAELEAIGYDIKTHDKVRKAELDGRSSQTELMALQSARAALAPLEREIATQEAQVERQRALVEREEAECRKSQAELAEMQEGVPDLYTAERELMLTQERENQARMEVGMARQKVDVLEGQKLRKRDTEKQREEQQRLAGRYKQLERAFGKDGVPALLIEQALPEIENRANEILERLSSGGMSVRFVTQAAYKDRRREDLKETLDIQISDSSGTRDYEMYSGGEAFRVNFAIRLALSEVLAQRSGTRLQTLVIDEGFGSQDTLGRQRLIEAIKMVSHDFSKILVITHIDELKDAFPARIEVEKSLSGSRVRVIS